MKLLGLRRVLVAAPLLALVSAWVHSSADVQTVEPATTVATAEATQEVVLDAALASNCTYYSDASHLFVVGQFGYDCCNNPVAWGVKTSFSVCGGCFPCFPPPR